jgi:hypothetical protein
MKNTCEIVKWYFFREYLAPIDSIPEFNWNANISFSTHSRPRQGVPEATPDNRYPTETVYRGTHEEPLFKESQLHPLY